MKDKITVNIGTDHSYDCKTDVIGRAGEGNVTQMEFKIPSKLCSCSLYLDFEKPNGETYRTPKLAIIDGVATYNVQPFVLTDSGEIKVQAVFEKASGEIWKSEIKMYTNRKSINISEDVDGYVVPSGTLPIKENGTFDVTMFKIADVAVEVKVYDGTINIESGNTTISGSYLINQQKAYDAIRALTSTKTFAVEFGAGSVPDGGDEMNFTSMTFDATNDLIKYGDIEAFRCDTYMVEGDGFAGYNSAGGTGNGARINFAEGTEVRTAFKELFLSIADAI